MGFFPMKCSSVLIYMCLMLSCVRAFGCELTMRIYSFAPLAMQNEQKQWVGTDVDYGNALAKQLGCGLRLVEAPWARGMEMLKAGKIDFMVNVTRTKAREAFLHFVGPQRTEVVRLVSQKGRMPLVTSWAQMSTLDAVLMRQRGSKFGPQLEQLLKDNKILSSKMLDVVSNDVRISLIERQRVDGILVDELFVDYYNSNKPRIELEKHPLMLSTIPVYFAFSKANTSPERIREIREAFDKLVVSKSYLDIGKKYP